MTAPKSLDAADCAVFAVLTGLGYMVGLYFSLAGRSRKAEPGERASSEAEAFLGGRTLPASALTISVLASAVNGMAVVAFMGHYYGHGFHINWWIVFTPISVVITSTALVPLLYKLRVASIFQYLRLRFDNKVGITACVVYFVFSQTLGAVAIYSAAIGISTMFPVPLIYSTVAIGLAGTVYTALGGLRGVVWADCVQAAVMLVSPFVIIGKVLYDSGSARPPLRPLKDLDFTDYMLRTNFDLTSDENVWTNVAGGLPFALVRTGFDQMAVQRFIAARTLRQAKWISAGGAFSFALFQVFVGFGSLSLIYWYRDCDPLLVGDIKTQEQIVPYFIRERLSEVTVLRGLLLSGVLGASTSTVSSVVNSHAAIFYIDVVSPFVKMSERRAVVVMRLLAFASGTIMTLFAAAVPYMGSAARLFVNLYTSASGPFAGLVLVAISSPWVNSKGAAWSCLLVCALQLWHGVGRGLSGVGGSPAITGTLDRCPQRANGTEGVFGLNSSIGHSLEHSPYVFPLYRVSYFWMGFFGFLLTVVLATPLSVVTGGVEKAEHNHSLTSTIFLKLWRRFRYLGLPLKLACCKSPNSVRSPFDVLHVWPRPLSHMCTVQGTPLKNVGCADSPPTTRLTFRVTACKLYYNSGFWCSGLQDCWPTKYLKAEANVTATRNKKAERECNGDEHTPFDIELTMQFERTDS